MDHKPRIIHFQSRDEFLRVDLTSIVYFEAEANYTRFVSFNGDSTLVFINLGKMEELLSLRFKAVDGNADLRGKWQPKAVPP